MLEKGNKQLESINTQLNEKINHLNSKIVSLENTLDDLEQYSRSTNLLIHGVPPTAPPGEPENNLAKHVVQLLSTNMGITVHESDISVAHRIGRATPNQRSIETPHSSDLSSGDHVRNPKQQPIIVQFANKMIRNQILKQRKSLKGKGMTITEQLTTRRASLLKNALTW